VTSLAPFSATGAAPQPEAGFAGHATRAPSQRRALQHPAGQEAGRALDRAAELLAGRRTAILTGAGISTDSGIPDYRGPGSPPRKPMTFQEFLTPEGCQRYWARSFVGWRRMHVATPNDGHRALARLSSSVTGIVTQNVDGLHQAAGSPSVLDLHGRIDRVRCLSCGDRSARAEHQQRMKELNPDSTSDLEVEIAPDGDALLEDTSSFRLADCVRCGGILKPDVVFFGESVPPADVATAITLVESAQALLVAGTSLTVYSGRRFVKLAYRQGIPIVLVNRGPTRADELVTVRCEGGASEVLSALADRLLS
jgi:NAD-dependent SIR2 family protein deacetylase